MKYYYTSSQIRKKFKWSRQMLSMVAIREGWKGDFRHRPRWYDAIQVRQYEISRLHTDTAISAGLWRNGQRIIRHDTKLQSAICPVCAMSKLAIDFNL